MNKKIIGLVAIVSLLLAIGVVQYATADGATPPWAMTITNIVNSILGKVTSIQIDTGKIASIKTTVEGLSSDLASVKSETCKLPETLYSSGTYTLSANTPFVPNGVGPPPFEAFQVLFVHLPEGETAQFTVTVNSVSDPDATLYVWADVAYADGSRNLDMNALELSGVNHCGTATFVGNSFMLRLDITDSNAYEYNIDWAYSVVATHGAEITVNTWS